MVCLAASTHARSNVVANRVSFDESPETRATEWKRVEREIARIRFETLESEHPVRPPSVQAIQKMIWRSSTGRSSSVRLRRRWKRKGFPMAERIRLGGMVAASKDSRKTRLIDKRALLMQPVLRVLHERKLMGGIQSSTNSGDSSALILSRQTSEQRLQRLSFHPVSPALLESVHSLRGC